MSYISSEVVTRAITRMRDYHRAQKQLHEKFDIDFLANRGRRNIIMSQAQEEFLASELAEHFGGTRSDGRTGEADIYIEDLDKELECKITSPLESTGAIQFQTDYATLEQKGELDYIYIIACPAFEKFCALHFENLTIGDYREPSPGARGKSSMIKRHGMEKCNVLHGQVINLSTERLSRLERELDETFFDEKEKLKENEALLANLREHLANDTDPRDGTKMKSKRRCALRKRIKNAVNRPKLITDMFNKRRERVRLEIADARNKSSRFTFVLEPLS